MADVPTAGLNDQQLAWVKSFTGIDPGRPGAAAGEPSAGAPQGAQPGTRPGTQAAAEPPGGGGKKEPKFDGPLGNPFDAPEAQVEIEKLALPVIRQLAVEQAQNAARDFLTAVQKVKAAKKAQGDAEQAKRELMWTIAITIALMPAGPIVEAAAASVAGPVLQKKMLEAVVSNAGTLEAKFGAKGAQAANKAFDVLAGEALTNLAKKFDAGKAKGALEAGVGALKGKAIKFAASSDKYVCVANYLDAMVKAANDSMHNLTDLIQTTQSYSEAIAFYNYFSKPLQGIYEATVGQQADDMLSQVAGPLSETADKGFLSSPFHQEIIVKMNAYGRTLFAHVEKTISSTRAGTFTFYDFIKWVTPDMEPMAAKLMAEELDPSKIRGHLPDPKREPGERVVLVDGWGRERVLLIGIEDQGIFWKDYGVRTFKQWPEDAEQEQAFRSRAAMQIGGLDKVDLGTIKGVKPPSN